MLFNVDVDMWHKITVQSKIHKFMYIFTYVIIFFQGDLRRMWSEPFISQQPSKHMDVWQKLWIMGLYKLCCIGGKISCMRFTAT